MTTFTERDHKEAQARALVWFARVFDGESLTYAMRPCGKLAECNPAATCEARQDAETLERRARRVREVRERNAKRIAERRAQRAKGVR